MGKLTVFLQKTSGILYPLKYAFRKINVSDKCLFGKGSVPVNSVFEGRNVIKENVRVIDSRIGEGTYISKNSELNKTSVGRYCSIADNVKVIVGKHPTEKFVSTYPSFYYDTREQLGFTFYDGRIPLYDIVDIVDGKFSVIIGNDVWIGSGVIITGGITIGDGAVIAAGSVVNKDVEPYSIVGGVPAKEIRKRYSPEVIEKLLSSKWWNRGYEWINNNRGKFTDIELFLKETENE
ncbi:MAG: CatB-related O-acetyltransferase [Rikenellaceae bacterium]|nr:CatB-related O-acetyltransferase [Rikenellaceae bacterium]